MKERQFQGMLNSKSIYGQSYGDYACFRLGKLNKIRIYPTEIYNYGGDVEWGMMHIAESKGLPCTNTTLMPRPDYEKIGGLYRWYDAKDDCYVFSWEEK